MILYFKRREFLSEKIASYIDSPIFTAMLLAVVYGAYRQFSDLHFLSWFNDLNPSLIFWGVLLLGMFLSLILLFVLQWLNALVGIVKRRAFYYDQNNIPAFLYYLAVGWMVHLEALKYGLTGLPREMLPRVSTVLKERGLLVVPLLIIVYLLISGRSPFLAAYWGIILSVSMGQIHKRTSSFLLPIVLSLPDILSALEWGTKNAISIGAAVACVGFIVGGTTLTGLGLKFAATVINLAQATVGGIAQLDIFHLITGKGLILFFTLFYTMIACFILGMGIPTTAQYIVASMIAAPALMQWGIHPLVSHMFVLYFAVLADVTPPVALAAYAASGISGADPFRTGLTAFRLSSAGFLIPYVFVSAPIILWYPTIIDGKTPFDYLLFAQVMITAILGIMALGATMIGYFRTISTVLERILTGIAAAFLIVPETTTDFIGFFVLLAVFLLQTFRKRKVKTAAA